MTSPDDRPPLPDAAARDRIAQDLGATLFVEAGAGSGKTSSLVQRVTALVQQGVPVPSIAAITFTEKAAAELRDRIRRELEDQAGEPGERGRLADAALRDLDAAAIGTLHSFAQRLLSERAIEAGLPPRLEVVDEVTSSVTADERWTGFVDALLDDPEAAVPLRICLTHDIRLRDLRTLSRRFEDNWDLLQDCLPAEDPPLPPAIDGPATARRVREVTARFLAETAPRKKDGSLYANAERCAERWEALATELEAAGGRDEPGRALAVLPGCRAGKGEDPVLLELSTELAELRSRELLAALARLGRRIGRFVLDEAERRRRAGTLEFHDLLVLARQLLRRSPEARAGLAGRYRHLLLDEFQDTDPIQIEIAVLLGAADPLDPALGSTRWQDVQLREGALFFVGDPKQSIYRFRRADIALFLAAQERVGDTVELLANFRSVPGVIDWVNAVCEGLIVAEPGSQPEYRGLRAMRPATGEGPVVALLDGLHRTVGDARLAEGRQVAGMVRRILDEGWTVRDERDPNRQRPAGLGDVCILLPGRNSLDALQDALDDAGIPYRTDASTLVYAAEEVRELFAALRAVDDPGDSLSQVTALRSSLFGCGDDDLATYRLHHDGRTWNLRAPEPEGMPPDHPVAAARAVLRDLHHRRMLLTPAELMEELLRRTHGYEVQASRPRHRERWRRLRFVVDQARAWGQAGDGSLRGYLRWVQRQSSDNSRVSESVLPESDTDAVRIMTIHSAKGLEFPVCIVAGLATRPQTVRARADAVFTEDGPAYRAGKANMSPEYEAQVPIDEQMDAHERLRLLYVALTRACDHLVVSLHRPPPAKEHVPGPGNGSLAQQVADRLQELGDTGAVTYDPDPVVGTAGQAGSDAVLPPYVEWSAARDAALAAGRRRTTVSATAVAHFDVRAAEDVAPEVLDDEDRTDVDPGLQKQGRNLELPPWQKGRYGTAVGRAVHGVLQAVDLATGEGLDDAVRSQAAAEGLLGREAVIERLARAALDSDAVRDAVAQPHWKEMFVAAPLPDGTTLEGYLDLVHRSTEGLVVVDYKTDAVPDDAALDAKVATYRIQLAAYAVALEQVLDERVARCRLVFLREDGAHTVDVEDLDEARAEAAARAAALARG
jgi:ATP-dependent exoDNAse (exonuclease V) beta subunit